MNYQISTHSAAEVQASCIVVTIDQSGKLSDSAAAIDNASQGYLQASFYRRRYSGQNGTDIVVTRRRRHPGRACLAGRYR